MKIAGFICIYLAGLGWISELIIPFTNLPHKMAIFGVVLVVSELLFLAGVALLGKTYYAQIKERLLQIIRYTKK